MQNITITTQGAFLAADHTARNQDITGTTYIYNGGSLSAEEVLFLLSFPTAGRPMPEPSPALPRRPYDRRTLAEVSQEIAEIINADPDYFNERSNGLEVGELLSDEDTMETGAQMMRDGIAYSTRTLRDSERAALVNARRFHGIEDIVLTTKGTVKAVRQDGKPRRPRRVRAANRKK
jgi:hypothetical protein